MRTFVKLASVDLRFNPKNLLPAAGQSALEHVAVRSGYAVTVTSVIVTIGLLACWIPARRAVRIEPMVALRQD